MSFETTNLASALRSHATALGFAVFGSAVLLGAGLVSAQDTCPGGSGTPITIGNFKANETIGYDLPLLKGTVAAGTQSVTLSAGGEAGTWPATGGIYKGFVRLKPGANKVVVTAAAHQNACLDITYMPNPFANQVRLAFVVPKGFVDGMPYFNAPPGEPADLTSLRKRLGFGAMLQQSLVSDLLGKAGKARLAPHIVRDASGNPDILILQSDKTKAELEAGSSGGAFTYAENALKAHDDGRTRFAVFYATVPGIYDLAAGTLAGLDHVYAWPQDLSELVSRYTDRRTPKELNLPGSGSDTNSLASWVQSDYGFWFKLNGLWVLDVPKVDTVTMDVFGRAYRSLSTLFMVKTETGADILKEDYALSTVSADGLAASSWLVDPNPPRLAALPPQFIPKGLVQGVGYKYYEGGFEKLPDFQTFSPTAKGAVPNFSLDPRLRDENIAFLFEAYLDVPRSGPWLFQISSDDGSRLIIDGKTVIENDGLHGNFRVARGTALDSGLHRIQVQYFNKGTDRSLGVQWAGASKTMQAIPNSALLREPDQTAIRVLEPAFAVPSLRLLGNQVHLTLSHRQELGLSMISPSGRHLATLFQGVLPAGAHRFPVPASTVPGAHFFVIKREGVKATAP